MVVANGYKCSNYAHRSTQKVIKDAVVSTATPVNMEYILGLSISVAILF